MRRIDPLMLAYVMAAVFGISTLWVGLANLLRPEYGELFLKMLAGVYPGYHFEERGLGSVLVATGYSLVHGAILGWLFGFLLERLRKNP